jgi:3',5'-cyclic AMP phosphodiesterase CpdA
MRTIVQISDLHFGRINPFIINPLLNTINKANPDLIVVTGDLTQRAKTIEFQKAKAFLDTLKYPKIVVPGNHDIPTFNLFERFSKGLEKYQKHITKNLNPTYIDEQIAIAGINTARTYKWRGGTLDIEQVQKICSQFSKLPKGTIKIVALHHSIDLPWEYATTYLVGKWQKALEIFIKCKIDIFLSGHNHRSHIHLTSDRNPHHKHVALVFHCGTSTSTRTRGGEQNSFNIIQITNNNIQLEKNIWNPDLLFFEKLIKKYQRVKNGWEDITQ